MLAHQDLAAVCPKETFKRQFSTSTIDEDSGCSTLESTPSGLRQDSASTLDSGFYMESPKTRWADLSEEDYDTLVVEPSPCGSLQEDDDSFVAEPSPCGALQDAVKEISRDEAAKSCTEGSAQGADNLLHSEWGGISSDMWRRLHTEDWYTPISGYEAFEDWGGISYDKWCKLYWTECVDKTDAPDEVYEEWGGIAYGRWCKLFDKQQLGAVGIEHAGRRRVHQRGHSVPMDRRQVTSGPNPTMPPPNFESNSMHREMVPQQVLQASQGDQHQDLSAIEVFIVTLKGIPHSLCKDACLEAIFEASGLERCVLGFRIIQKGYAEVNFDTVHAATHFCNHLRASSWAAGQLQVEMCQGIHQSTGSYRWFQPDFHGPSCYGAGTGTFAQRWW